MHDTQKLLRQVQAVTARNEQLVVLATALNDTTGLLRQVTDALVEAENSVKNSIPDQRPG